MSEGGAAGRSAAARAVAFLRSRRLAVGLLLYVTAFSAIGTIVPQAAREPEKVAGWAARYPGIEPLVRALGLHDAFTAPIFLVPLAVLFLSTVACAWERTRAAARALRPSPGLTEADVARLTDRPHARIAAPTGLDGPAALAAARVGLERIGLRCRLGTRTGEAVGGRWGLLGSPLFHWSLAALFLVIGLGQLTRAEGMIGVPIGYSVPDVAASYGRWTPGPLYGERSSGLAFSASDFTLETPIDGIDRGPSAVITLRRGDTVVASQRVYPNNPLRHGTLMVHQNNYGLAVALEATGPDGRVAASARSLVDFDPARPSGTTPADLEMTTASGARYEVEVTVPADRRGGEVVAALPGRAVAALRISTAGTATVEATLTPGASVRLADGSRIHLVSVGYYTRLSVVDDWTVYPIYALFTIAAAGLCLAVFAPHRVVRLLAIEGAEGTMVHLVARHSRRDPLFAENVESAVRGALQGPVAQGPDGQRPDEGVVTS